MQPFRIDTSVRLEWAQLFRTDTSVHRIHAPIQSKWVDPKHTHIFGQNGHNHFKQVCPFAEQTHPFLYNFQCWSKEFSLFLLPVKLLNQFNLRLGYLIHSETELNMWIYYVHLQWKENTFQPSSVQFKQRVLLKIQLEVPKKLTWLIPTYATSHIDIYEMCNSSTMIHLSSLFHLWWSLSDPFEIVTCVYSASKGCAARGHFRTSNSASSIQISSRSSN